MWLLFEFYLSTDIDNIKLLMLHTKEAKKLFKRISGDAVMQSFKTKNPKIAASTVRISQNFLFGSL